MEIDKIFNDILKKLKSTEAPNCPKHYNLLLSIVTTALLHTQHQEAIYSMVRNYFISYYKSYKSKLFIVCLKMLTVFLFYFLIIWQNSFHQILRLFQSENAGVSCNNIIRELVDTLLSHYHGDICDSSLLQLLLYLCTTLHDGLKYVNIDYQIFIQLKESNSV